MEIIDYPNYLIYDDGRVYSKYKNKFLKPRINIKNAYHSVGLCNNGKQKYFYIHRLVGLHYLEKIEGKDCIDHIDRDKSNNHVNNLRWCNHSENNINKIIQSNNKLGIKNIFYCQTYKCYFFQISRNDIKHSKKFKTLEECIKYRDEYLEKL